jgi:hypothetical protein
MVAAYGGRLWWPAHGGRLWWWLMVAAYGVAHGARLCGCLDISTSASPPDVRHGSALPQEHHQISGLRPPWY